MLRLFARIICTISCCLRRQHNMFSNFLDKSISVSLLRPVKCNVSQSRNSSIKVFLSTNRNTVSASYTNTFRPGSPSIHDLLNFFRISRELWDSSIVRLQYQLHISCSVPRRHLSLAHFSLRLPPAISVSDIQTPRIARFHRLHL